MSNKFVAPGDVIGYANTGAELASGAVVVIRAGGGGMIGVTTDIILATTGYGALGIKGIYELACLSTVVAAQWDAAYWDAGNSRLTNVASGNTPAGLFAKPKADAETTAQVLLIPSLGVGAGMLYNQVAAGTALSNATAETILGSFSIPAGSMRVGDKYRVRYQGIATATNSTDTLLIRLRIGGVAGTAILTGTATDVANNDVFAGDAEITIRTIGASGTFVAVGEHTDVPAASGTASQAVAEITASTAIDTTAAQVVCVTGTWSVASASNSCRLDLLSVERIR